MAEAIEIEHLPKIPTGSQDVSTQEKWRAGAHIENKLVAAPLTLLSRERERERERRNKDVRIEWSYLLHGSYADQHQETLLEIPIESHLYGGAYTRMLSEGGLGGVVL